MVSEYYNFVEFMRCLIAGSKDAVGTVREAAFKSLTDLILVMGSMLSSEIVHIKMFEKDGELLKAIQIGCFDSKLTTRINAVNALCSFLLVNYSIISNI